MDPDPKSGPSTGVALLLYAIVSVLLFGSSFATDRILVPIHTERLEPWRSDLSPERDAELAEHEQPAQSDKVISFRADDTITVAALRDARLPLWNPTNAGGVPHLAQGLYGVFYPPHLLYVWLSPERAYGFLAALHHLLAAFFTFLWLRKAGASGAGAFLGGLAFGFSGCLFDRLHYYQYIESFAWLPLGLLCIEHWFDGRRAALPALALTGAMVLLPGWPQCAGIVFNVWLLVVFVRALGVDLEAPPLRVVGAGLVAIAVAVAVAPLLPDALLALAFWPHLGLLLLFAFGPCRNAGPRPRRRFAARLLLLCGALLLAGLVAAPQFLPAFEWMREGGVRAVTAPESLTRAGMRPLFLLAAIVPKVFGTPWWPWLENSFNLTRALALDAADFAAGLVANRGSLVENALYPGLVATLLMPFGIAAGAAGARFSRYGLVVVLVVFLGFALGVAAIVYPAYFLFPGLQLGSDPRRALVAVTFAAAALAAFGFDTVRAHRRAAGAAVAAAAGLALGCFFIARQTSSSTLLRPLLDHAAGIATALGFPPYVPQDAQQAAVELIRGSFFRAGAIAAAAALALTLPLLRLRAGLCAAALLAVFAADLGTYDAPRAAAMPRGGFLGTHPLIEHLRASVGRDGRLARYAEGPPALLGVALPPNLAGCYGLLDAWCYTVSPPEAWERVAATIRPDLVPPASVALHPLNCAADLAARGLDVLGVRAIIGMGPRPDPLPSGIEFDGAFGAAWVLRNERAPRRAHVVGRARATAEVFTTDPEHPAAPRIATDFDPRDEVALDAPPKLEDSEGSLPSAILAEDLPERVTVRLEGGDRDGILVLRDTYASGWSATLDGAPAPILRADLAMRAVVVPAGSREVVFSYAPRAVRIGVVVGLAALAFALALLFLGVTRDDSASP